MKKICWLDLETTGLNPRSEMVLSLGMRLTDEKLNTIDEVEWDVQSAPCARPGCIRVDGAFIALEPVVFDMHTKSGLLERMPNAPFTWKEIRTLARARLLQWKGDGSPLVMAGSTVHFDKAFLLEHAPELLTFFGYRLLDVSTFKVIADTWAPDRAQAKGQPAHTPLKDIEASIESLRHYRTTMLQEGVIQWAP